MISSQRELQLTAQDLVQNYTGSNDLKAELNNARQALINVLRSNLETIKPIISDVRMNERINSILIILQSAITDLPSLNTNNVDEFRNRLSLLVDIHKSLQPSVISKIAKVGFTSNAREQIKALLNVCNVNLRESLDPHIENYLLAQCNYIANFIAVSNACEQSSRIAKLYSRFPSGNFEIIILKRHEVCSNLHKAFGLNSDTGLDALHFGQAQSKFELTAAKSVQNQQLLIMKELVNINRVDMIVSPVTRAYETALYATFSPETIDSVTVDNYYSEVQMNTTIISSGRAYRLSSDVAKDFVAAGYKNVSSREDFVIHGENQASFYIRRDKALRSLLIQNEVQEKKINMKIIVGHGGMNNCLVDCLKANIAANTIPNEARKLDFGGHYNIILVRDENQQIILADDGGITNRYGSKNNTRLLRMDDLVMEQSNSGLDTAIDEETPLIGQRGK